MSLNYVPQAMYALETQKIDTFGSTNLLRAVDGSGNPTTAPALDPTQLANLNSLIAGTSTQYATSASFGTVQNFAKTTLPTCAAGEVLKSNGSALSCVTDATGSGGSGTVTNVTSANNYLTVATGSTTPVLTLNVGTAPNTVAPGDDSRITGALQSGATAGGSLTGTYPSPTIANGAIVDAQISSSAAISDSKLATITTAGKVSGNAITSGTIGGSTSVNTSGNIQTTGAVKLYDSTPSNSVGLKAPTTVTTSYDLIFPTAKPSVSGYVLAGDTSGNLTWVAPSSGSVTSVTATAPVISSGGATPVISMSQANTTTAGYLSSADWNSFNGKMSSTLSSGNIFVGNGSNVATGVVPSGDVSMTNAGAFTVTKVQNTAVSSTTPTTAGQVLRFSGTQWTPNFLSMFDLRSTITGTQAFGGVGCTAGQTLTWTVATDNLSCTTIAINDSQISNSVSRTANTFLAAPNGSAGVASYRTIASADLPSITSGLTGTLPATNGGTGQASYTIGDILYASSSTALSSLSAGTNGYVLTSGGPGVAPSWSASVSSQWVTSGSDIYYSAGRVGIGTSTPSATLDINGNISFAGGVGAKPGFHFNTVGSADSYGINLGFGLDTQFNVLAQVADRNFHVMNDSGLAAWKTSSVGNTTQLGTLTVNGGGNSVIMGNLGIGTGSPTYKLDVSGQARFTGDVRSETGFYANQPSGLHTYFSLSNMTTYGRIAAGNDSGDLPIALNPYGGNVGIGTTSPQTTLQVAGVISPATNNTYTLGNATYRFTEVYATNGVINTSDRREKKNIYNTDLGLDFINKLRPVSYRWNTGVDNDVHYGLIAQEAQQAIAEVGKTEKTSIVTHDEATDRYGVRYSELISPLIKAAQELYSRLVGVESDVTSLKAKDAVKDREIASLKADNAAKDQKIKNLEQENAAIKARLDKIEKALKSK